MRPLTDHRSISCHERLSFFWLQRYSAPHLSSPWLTRETRFRPQQSAVRSPRYKSPPLKSRTTTIVCTAAIAATTRARRRRSFRLTRPDILPPPRLARHRDEPLNVIGAAPSTRVESCDRRLWVVAHADGLI